MNPPCWLKLYIKKGLRFSQFKVCISMSIHSLWFMMMEVLGDTVQCRQNKRDGVSHGLQNFIMLHYVLFHKTESRFYRIGKNSKYHSSVEGPEHLGHGVLSNSSWWVWIWVLHHHKVACYTTMKSSESVVSTQLQKLHPLLGLLLLRSFKVVVFYSLWHTHIIASVTTSFINPYKLVPPIVKNFGYEVYSKLWPSLERYPRCHESQLKFLRSNSGK